MKNKNHIKRPYDVWWVDDFLSEKQLDIIETGWPSTESNLWYHGHKTINGKHNPLEKNMLGISDLSLLSDELRELIEYFHTDDCTTNIKNIFDIDDELVSDYTFRWSGIRVMLPGAFQLIHSDARRNPFNGMRKELTCLLYFNKNWKREDEGCLEIWSDSMEKRYEIEPVYNRLVVFRNSDTSYHGVPKVNKIRRMLSWSILSDSESTDRTKAQFLARPNVDHEDINSIGLERSKIEDI
mgnify:CR=1 FL=1|tara:strand:- start:1628 stop:2344 length:717 start_codon:yes stop_codon:yes gene_type:complete